MKRTSSHWWFGAHHLYQTFVQPVYFGSKTEGPLLGFLIIGYEIDDRLAREVSKVSASQVAFSYGDEIVATTLTPRSSSECGRAGASGWVVAERTRGMLKSAMKIFSLLLSTSPDSRKLPCA